MRIRDGKNSDPDADQHPAPGKSNPYGPRSESLDHIISVVAEVMQVNTACGCVACPGPPLSRILRIFWSAAGL
jgi:hypothetical protein